MALFYEIFAGHFTEILSKVWVHTHSHQAVESANIFQPFSCDSLGMFWLTPQQESSTISCRKQTVALSWWYIPPFDRGSVCIFIYEKLPFLLPAALEHSPHRQPSLWPGSGTTYSCWWYHFFLKKSCLRSSLSSFKETCLLSRLVISESWDPMDCSPPDTSVHGDSPGKNTGVGYHFLLHQGILPIQYLT